MSFFKELFSSMKFNARERTTNIYIGSFAFSWVTINWKFWIILLFGDGIIDSRIEHVSKIINWLDGFLFPVLMSVGICFILPFANKLIAKYQYEPNNYVKRISDISETKSLKRLAGIERLKAKAESARSRENAAQELAIQKLNEQIQESKDNSQQLTLEIENLKNNITELNSKIITDEKDYNDAIRERDEKIKTLTKTKSDNSEQIKNLVEQIAIFKKQVEEFKETVSSKKPGVGLPKYNGGNVIIGDTLGRLPLDITLKASTKLDNPSVTAFNLAMQSPTMQSVKKSAENPIVGKVIEASNFSPSQAANVAKPKTDLHSANSDQSDLTSDLKPDNQPNKARDN